MKQKLMPKELSENIRLLYIENEEMVRTNTLKFLSPAFSHIDVAENGQIGLVRFLEKKHDLIGDDLDEIKDLESDIDYIISKTILNHHILAEDILQLAEKLNKYASILLLYPHFHLLAGGIGQLADAFKTNAKTSQEKADFIFSYAESFIFVLMKWRSDVAEKQLADPHCYDASILSDIEQMIAYLEGRENEIGNDVDFF